MLLQPIVDEGTRITARVRSSIQRPSNLCIVTKAVAVPERCMYRLVNQEQQRIDWKFRNCAEEAPREDDDTGGLDLTVLSDCHCHALRSRIP